MSGSSNLERAVNLANAGQYQASIARSLIVIAAALKMQVEDTDTDPNFAIRAYDEGYKDGQFDAAYDKEKAFLPLLNEDEATKLHQDWCEDPNCGSSNKGMSYG